MKARFLFHPFASFVRAGLGAGRIGLLAALGVSCDDGPQYTFKEGERLEVTVLERVNSWGGECVPLSLGDSFILTIGEFEGECLPYYNAECRQAPLVPEVPTFATGSQTSCSTGGLEDRLALYCSGEADAGCRPTMVMHVSPLISRGQKVAEKGYLVVRWNLDFGAENDAGTFSPCLDGCEEGFRVRIEMIDR